MRLFNTIKKIEWQKINSGIKLHKSLPSMRMLVISDLHDVTASDIAIKMETVANQYDVVLLLGDIRTDQIVEILEGATAPIYGILGNHDVKDLLYTTGIPSLHDNTTFINGISIAGLEGSHKYKEGNYAMYTQEENMMSAKTLPVADILISHDSYFGYCDDSSKNKCGFKGITHYLRKQSPQLHLFAHYHCPDAVKYNDTVCICCYQFTIVEVGEEVKATQI